MKVAKFWVVYLLGEFNGPAQSSHLSEEGADAEAEQLALKHPGDTLVVLEAKRACSVKGPAVWVDCGADAESEKGAEHVISDE
jgi:hypothetical protein